MAVSKDSTDEAGIVLVTRCFQEHQRLVKALEKYDRDREKWLAMDMSRQGLAHLADTVKYAAHRLAFLEMVSKGLSFQEMHDLRAYARFVDSKRKLEDLDLEELREMLR